MIPTKMSEARQSTHERRKIDRGGAAFTLQLRRDAHVYVAVDQRLAVPNTLPFWLIDANGGWEPVMDDVVGVSLEACNFMVLFHRVSPAGELRLGSAGVPGLAYLPYMVFLCELWRA
jgi:hypothetical protein